MYKFFEEVDESLMVRISQLNNYKNVNKLYWLRMLLGYSQLKGLFYGYNKEAALNKKFQKLTMADFLILQADGELSELESK